MPFMFSGRVPKRFWVIISPSDGFTPLDQLRTAHVADSPTTALSIVSNVAAARPDHVSLAFRHLTNCFSSTLHVTMGSNHLYIWDDASLEEWTVLMK